MVFAIPRPRTVRALDPPGLATPRKREAHRAPRGATPVYSNQNTAAEIDAQTDASAAGFVTIHQSRSTFVDPPRRSCR